MATSGSPLTGSAGCVRCVSIRRSFVRFRTTTWAGGCRPLLRQLRKFRDELPQWADALTQGEARGESKGGSVRATCSEVVDDVLDKAGDVAEDVADTAGDVVEGAGDMLEDVTDLL